MKLKGIGIFTILAIILFVTDAISQNQPTISTVPSKIYQSFTSTPDDFIKITYSNIQNTLYGIGTKGKYTFDLKNKTEKFLGITPFVSHGYIDYRDITLSKSINSTPYLNSEVVSDSSISMSINPSGEPFYLDNIDFSYSKVPTINSWYMTTIKKKIILNEPISKYLYDFNAYGYGASQWIRNIAPNPVYASYVSRPSIFNVGAFAIYDSNESQQNDFSALNIIKGLDGYYYLTAINDQFKSYPGLTIGGSDIKGTKENPNIYKFKYASRLDGTNNTSSPSFVKVGQGKLIHVDELGNLYSILADRVLKQAPNSTQVEVVAGGNDAGPASNQLILKVDSQQPIAFDSNQNLYICDYINERIVYWAKGSKQGKVLISRELNNLTSLKPISIALDQSNNIYVADNFSHSILKFENCTYMYKPIVNQISNEDLTSNFGKSTNWYFNNQLINKENQSTLKPKETGYYQAQSIDLNGCLSQRSDSLLFVCKPIKPEVIKKSKLELATNIPIDTKTYIDFDYSITNYGTVNLLNKSKNFSWWSWYFSDGTYSNQDIKTFNVSGNYVIQLTVGNSNKEVFKLEKNVKIDLPPNPSSNLIANIPIRGYNNIWEDVSGFKNHATFNGKVNQLTNRGIWPGSTSHYFSSIKLAGCNTENLNERIVIPNPSELKNTKAITMSAWFGLDPSISMNPANGTCGPNGRQVLFSKGGDGYGTSLPGFNALIDITNNTKKLLIEFSKNSGNFSMNIPLNGLLDSTQKVESLESYYFRDGDDYNSDYRAFYPKISIGYRSRNLENPFNHFIISFDETKIIVYLNGKKIAEEQHSIPFNEINQQDLFIGALGPKSTPFNGIYYWYPFKGRIDRIRVYNKLITDSEVYNLYMEKNSDD
jgi:Concanavalin A-like lectin/glucanases superfamily